MPNLSYKLAEIRCAFQEWMPQKQRILAVDFGETEETREETINAMWKRFMEILQSVEEAERLEKKGGGASP